MRIEDPDLRSGRAKQVRDQEVNVFWVYILQSETSGKFYVGQTSDVHDRLTRHNQGRVPSTSSKGPWKLVFSEEYQTRSSACQRELEIKNQKSRSFIERLVQNKKEEVTRK